MKAMRILGVAVLSLTCVDRAIAQPWVTYDAALGTFPQAQCWTHQEDIDPPMAYPFGVAAGDLHLSTLGFASNGATGGAVWWERTDVTINFANAFAVKARLRIVTAPNHSINVVGNPRPGYALAVGDVLGRAFWVGFGTAEIFSRTLSSGSTGAPTR